AELQQDRRLADLNVDLQVRGQEIAIHIDRDSAARFGITPRTIDQTLYGAFGQAQVSTIYAALNQYKVVMEAAPRYWQSSRALEDVHVHTPDGLAVPLATVFTFSNELTPLSVNHPSETAAARFTFNLPRGEALSDAVRAIDEAMARIGAPATLRGGFQGTARAFQASLQSQPWLILAALVAVYIVLGVLYESLVHPLTILS